jgi:hypothetical protein
MKPLWSAISALAILACGDAGTNLVVDSGTGMDPEPIELVVLPDTVSIVQGDSSTISLTLVGGRSIEDVNVAASGEPMGVAVTVANDPGPGPVIRATVRIRVGSTSPPGTYPITLRGTGAGAAPVTTFFSLTILQWPLDCPAGGALCGQWALSATASTEYTSDEWSAAQATGKPDVLGCGDDASAWASLEPDGVDWLELTYPYKVRPTGVRVYEVYGVSSIDKVEIKDAAGTYHTVYTGRPEVMPCPRVLDIPVSGIAGGANVVRVSLDQRSRNDWNEIDAVLLIGDPTAPTFELLGTVRDAAGFHWPVPWWRSSRSEEAVDSGGPPRTGSELLGIEVTRAERVRARATSSAPPELGASRYR